MADKYTWVAQGSSYAPSDLLAAYLLGQLEQIEQAQSQRRAAWFRYFESLRPLEEGGFLRRPVIPEGAESNHHLFHVLTDSEDARQHLIAHLKGLAIQAVFHYVPLHLSPMGAALGWVPGSLPVTEDAAARLLRLPLYAGITPPEQDRVIEGILGFYGGV